ncbi:ribonuclease T [Parafrankia sp. BMG5.11]|nr:ribonuclease T [Parafrankia sp. BMG5.11]
MRHLAVSAVLFVAVSPFPAAAQAYQCRVPARVAVPNVRPDGPARRMPVTGYVLALSWAPEFCKGRERRAADAVQCSGANGRFGLVVHGLWPQGRSNWPQWCPTTRKPSPADIRANLCISPSARLQGRQWAKHGACMVRTPAAYAKVTRILYQGLRLPDFDQLSKDPELNVGLIRRRFAAANPGWRADAVGVKLNQRGWLEELRLCYDRRFMPAPCGRRLGPPDRAPVRIWRGL